MPLYNQYLPLAGGTVTGNLRVNGSFTEDTFTNVNYLFVKGTLPYVDIAHPDFNAQNAATTTTGTINASSNSLTVTSASSFSVNQGIYVVGAGASSSLPLETYITAKAGNVLTLNASAGTTATTKEVGHSETRAIQAAIDAAGAGGTLLLQRGTYKISQITYPTDFTILGSGWDAGSGAATLLQSIPQNANDMLKPSSTSVFRARIAHLRIDGNKNHSSPPTFDAIFNLDFTDAAIGDRFFRFEDLLVTYAPVTAVHMKNFGLAYWNRVYVLYTGSHGILIDKDASGHSSYDQMFSQCHVGWAGNHCVYQLSGRDNMFQGCNIYQSGTITATGDGVHLGDGTSTSNEGFVMSGCRIDDNVHHSLAIDGSGVKYANIDFTSRGQDGSYIDIQNGATQNVIRMAAEPNSVGYTADNILSIGSGGGSRNNIDITHYDPSTVSGSPVSGAGADLDANLIAIRNGAGPDNMNGDLLVFGSDCRIVAGGVKRVSPYKLWRFANGGVRRVPN